MEKLKIENVICGYKDGFHLDKINMSIPKGKFAGIIGANGSGKSTLFKAIIGDLQLKEGSVLVDGNDLRTFSLQKKAQCIAVVPQFMELGSITVEEFVLMGRIPHRKRFQFFDTQIDKDIAIHNLELTGIIHLRHKNMNELSGGEQQMASIACALTQEPKLLLLDEPTSHLDITHQGRVMNLLQRLNQEQGLTIVIIIHDLNLAAEYCTHITLMKKGKIIKQGNPKQVLTYQNIESAYNSVVIVRENPISGKPVIFPISENTLREQRKAESLIPTNMT